MTSVNDPEQIPLQLPTDAAAAREDLVVTLSNQGVVEFLESWPQWPASIVVLAGPVGAGKTHLANVWAKQSGASFLTCGSVSELDNSSPENFVLEGVAKGCFDQTWLFHLFNFVRASNSSLLMTSRDWPGDWGITLPDLASRMKTTHLLELNEPDDTLLFGVLSKLFSDRQIQVDAKVVDYLVVRMERSLAAAQSIVSDIDSMSLAQKRAVTKSLASNALRNAGLTD